MDGWAASADFHKTIPRLEMQNVSQQFACTGMPQIVSHQEGVRRVRTMRVDGIGVRAIVEKLGESVEPLQSP